MAKNEQLKMAVEEIKVRLGMTQAEIARKLKLNPTYFSSVINGKYPFSPKLATGISKHFYINLTPDEESDESEMLKHETLAEQNNLYDNMQNNRYRLVPQYNMDARGGFGANDEIDTKEYVVDYIPFKDAKESDICIPVSGNSMSPVYTPGT
ncbi:MAG: hypothetical protein LBL79_08465, partial [Prevotella sp.]|nr:hypothetical protein [Prevotella sp.]